MIRILFDVWRATSAVNSLTFRSLENNGVGAGGQLCLPPKFFVLSLCTCLCTGVLAFLDDQT